MAFLLHAHQGQAQGQQKEMLRQILYLKLYIEKAKKGYETIRKGLQTISELKEGELRLHEDYFDSLSAVPQAIRNHELVYSTQAFHDKILLETSRFQHSLRDQDLFHGDEIAHIRRTLERLLTQCEGDLDVLRTLISDNDFSMTDGERLKQIKILRDRALMHYTFLKSFTSSISLLGLARLKERGDVEKAAELNSVQP